MTLKLKMAFMENPRIYPLQDGTVKPDNIELEVIFYSGPHPGLKAYKRSGGMLFYNNLSKGLECDISEMSLSETLLAKERNDSYGKGKWDWTPIPVFMSRGQFWANLYVNNSSGINGLEDLRGKRIGVHDYCMTAALWFRITLKDLYGIEAWDNTWYNWRSKELSHGAELGLHLKEYAVGKGVTHNWLTANQTADVMLDRGELDAIFPPNISEGNTAGNPATIDRYGGTRLTGNPRIRKLLDDQGEAAITEFFRKTGCYHANHHVIINNTLLREHPWVAMEMFKAFQRSKEVAYERASKTQNAYLYFEGNARKRQAAVFGEDPYPLGLRAMRKTVERAVQGSQEQGLIRKPIKVEDLYFPSTLDT
jgi:4,5-dihydroxyphthalate decarboxylase